MYIYRYIKDGNMLYIGKSKDVQQRLGQHYGTDYMRLSTKVECLYVKNEIDATYNL